MSEGIPESYAKIVDLALALGATAENLRRKPGAWVHRLDETWIIAINPHDEEIEVTIDGTMGGRLREFEAGIWFNGWLAGLINPAGGTIAAGAGANEDNFIRALDRALVKAVS